MKPCSECFYLREHNFGPCPNYRAPTCMHPRNLKVYDYVRGQNVPWLSPRLQRKDGFIRCRINGTCGKEGRFFKPTSTQTPIPTCNRCK